MAIENNLPEREKNFRDAVNRQIEFPHPMRVEFIDYWTETTPTGKKMRFELEKTWDLRKRLFRWQRTNFNRTPSGVIIHPSEKKPQPSKIPEVAELDQLLEQYKQHPTSIAFEVFGKYYEFLKQHSLLKPLTQSQINDLKSAYSNNNFKCRCACVQLTLLGYVDNSWTFAKVFELREKLQKEGS